jgi:hypothetical protein
MSASAAPAAVPAPQACMSAAPTAASYKWDFKGEANGIFEDVRLEAERAMGHADRLESYTRDPDTDWQLHAEQLLDLKGEINDIGAKLCRLQAIRREVDPWQQRIIDQIVATTRLMADNAQDAIVFAADHRRELWLSAYQKYVNNLWHETTSLTRSVDKAVEFAGVSKEYQELRSGLNAKSSS